MNEDYLEARVQLGLTYYTLGRIPDAIEAWKRVVRADPEREDANMYLRMVGDAAGPSEDDSPTPGTIIPPDKRF